MHYNGSPVKLKGAFVAGDEGGHRWPSKEDPARDNVSGHRASAECSSTGIQNQETLELQPRLQSGGEGLNSLHLGRSQSALPCSCQAVSSSQGVSPVPQLFRANVLALPLCLTFMHAEGRCTLIQSSVTGVSESKAHCRAWVVHFLKSKGTTMVQGHVHM